MIFIMKVLITTEFCPPNGGGVTRAVMTQKKALENAGHIVRVLTIGENTKSIFKTDNILGGGYYYIRKSNILPQFAAKDTYSSLALNDPILNDIFSWNPDIVHAHNEWFTMRFAVRIAKKLNIPLIHTLHTDFDSYCPFKSHKLWETTMKLIFPILTRKANVSISLTDKGHTILEKYGCKHRIVKIPIGMDLDFFRQKLTPEEASQLKTNYGISNNDVIIITISRLEKVKRIHESIHHFSNLRKLRKNIKFLVVGDGSEKKALESFVHDEKLDNDIIFTGFIPFEQVWKYYSLGDIFITSSLSENQGLMYNESLAAGLPLLARKDEPLEECLIEGVNGYSFTNDKEFLQKALLLIDDEDKRLEMGRNAANSVEKYSLDVFAAKLVNLYEEEIAKKKQSSR